MALTHLAHQLIRQHFDGKAKRLAIDTTLGNGHDTEFLLRLGFEKVLGFDVQETAISNTTERLKNAGLLSAEIQHAQLHFAGHQFLKNYLEADELVDCVMFNLGFLPHADKQLTTMTETTLQAINASIDVLQQDGLISILCYPGHDQGAIETKAVQEHLKELTEKSKSESRPWQLLEHLSRSPKPGAPILYQLRR